MNRHPSQSRRAPDRRCGSADTLLIMCHGNIISKPLRDAPDPAGAVSAGRAGLGRLTRACTRCREIPPIQGRSSRQPRGSVGF
jgi:hypothetical protein